MATSDGLRLTLVACSSQGLDPLDARHAVELSVEGDDLLESELVHEHDVIGVGVADVQADVEVEDVAEVGLSGEGDAGQIEDGQEPIADLRAGLAMLPL